MANIEISHEEPTVRLHPIKWSAAIWASVIGGLVFAALEVLMVPLFQGKSHGSSIFTHLVQGGLWTYLYKILARRAVTEVR